jgi:3-hydroxy-D-aspartate aldolase
MQARLSALVCPTAASAGPGTFEFETASGVYTELQCGSYILMDADYGPQPRRGSARALRRGAFTVVRVRKTRKLRRFASLGHQATRAQESGLVIFIPYATALR